MPGLAVDADDGKLYFSVENRVEVANLQFTWKRTFISFTSSSAAVGIALDVRNRYVLAYMLLPIPVLYIYIYIYLEVYYFFTAT